MNELHVYKEQRSIIVDMALMHHENDIKTGYTESEVVKFMVEDLHKNRNTVFLALEGYSDMDNIAEIISDNRVVFNIAIGGSFDEEAFNFFEETECIGNKCINNGARMFIEMTPAFDSQWMTYQGFPIFKYEDDELFKALPLYTGNTNPVDKIVSNDRTGTRWGTDIINICFDQFTDSYVVLIFNNLSDLTHHFKTYGGILVEGKSN